MEILVNIIGLKEEGIFRIPGSQEDVDNLKNGFNTGLLFPLYSLDIMCKQSCNFDSFPLNRISCCRMLKPAFTRLEIFQHGIYVTQPQPAHL